MSERLNPTDWLVTPDLKRPETWRYPIRHDIIRELAKASDGYYHRMYDGENLRKAVRGRPVGIMLHGASINELEERAEEFAQLDICYLSVNRFEVMERRILGRMGRQLDVVFLMSEQEMPRRIHDTHAYLDRGDGLLMTTFSALSWLERADRMHIVEEHDSQLYIMPRLLCRPVYPISLALILDQLVLCGIGKAVLFGADGYEPKDGDEWNQAAMLATYYDPGFFVKEKRPCGLAFGTRHFNSTFEYNPDDIEVVNCSTSSYLKPFRKISYDQLQEVIG